MDYSYGCVEAAKFYEEGKYVKYNEQMAKKYYQKAESLGW